MLDLSFRTNVPPLARGGPEDYYTFEHYSHFIFGSKTATDAFNFVDLGVFGRTIFVSMLVTIANLLFCYPIAFYIAKIANPSTARLLIVSLIIPFWINELLRSFALRILFANEGVINNFLTGVGILADVEFAPVPAITGILPCTYSMVFLITSMWSLKFKDGDSPVVPTATIPLVPLSICQLISFSRSLKFISPFACMGVTIATIDPFKISPYKLTL